MMMDCRIGISRNPRIRRDARTEWIGESRLAVEVRIVGFVALRGIGVFAHYRETCTRAADGHAALDGVIQGNLHRSPHPKVDVVGLVSSGDKQRTGMTDCSCDERIERSFSTWDNEGCNRVQLAHALDVAVVLAGARRAQHQKVSASSPNAQPSERLVEILSSAHQGKAGPRHGRDIRLIPHAKILVGVLLR